MKPLEGLLVLEFCQYLSGPATSLRLADLGARVIKVERPQGGDNHRRLANNNLFVDGDSVLFHTVNRNKESLAVNLKDADDLARVKKLVRQADVLIHNFRPGVIERIGLGYEAVREMNPGLVYAEITGYGSEGPWRDKPGQDLLLQAVSGLTWLNGNADMPPTPFGLAIADTFAAAYATQGILACLVRRGVTGKGGLVQISLLEALLDFQFEVLTTYLNDGRQAPRRSAVNSAHAYLAAPYGIYETADGFIALAMGSIVTLGELLGCEPLLAYQDPDTWFTRRDEIKQILVDHLKTGATVHWLSILEPADIWCADVLTWDRLMEHEGFKVLDFVMETVRGDGVTLQTTRCPIRIDGEILVSHKGAPRLGADNETILRDYGLD